jgi:hypothetical protein
MAKATSKPAATAKAPAKTVTKKPAPKKATVNSADLIVKACEASLAKLSELDIEYQLQAEINWCLGSYHNDNNPVGLYHMADRALQVFKGELAKKTKGVTAKLVSDLEKALKAS